MLKKIRYRLAILKKLNHFAFGVRKYFILIAIISGISIVMSLIIPSFYRIFVDQVIIGRDIGTFAFVVAGYLSFFVLNTFLPFLRNYSNNRLLLNFCTKI